jgi:hypothetical protein
MTNAAMTYVFNEHVNLPLWIKHYGGLFGTENLFVIDRSSTDGSTLNLGAVNVIRVPRTQFDDYDKSHAMSSLHSLLLRSYDAVVTGDCDELLVPDPARYADLNDYIARMDGAYATALGMHIVHVMTHEPALDLQLPVLSQRRFLSFDSGMCKTLVSRIPQQWSPGLHATIMPPAIDPELFIFHLKTMDYGIAMMRQAINQDTSWSDQSIRAHHGEHHRSDLQRFVKSTFLSAVKNIAEGRIYQFDFDKIIAELNRRTAVNSAGFHHLPFGIHCMFHLPERFEGLL